MTLKRNALESYKAFQSWVIDVQFFDRDFLTYINKKYLKKFKKRLANLYMYIQKGKLSEIISESKIKVDTNAIKKWSKDLRVLTKAYKQIGSDSEDPQAIKDFKKVRRAFGTFQENFEKWVYKFFCNINGKVLVIKQNLGKKKKFRKMLEGSYKSRW